MRLNSTVGLMVSMLSVWFLYVPASSYAAAPPDSTHFPENYISFGLGYSFGQANTPFAGGAGSSVDLTDSHGNEPLNLSWPSLRSLEGLLRYEVTSTGRGGGNTHECAREFDFTSTRRTSLRVATSSMILPSVSGRTWVWTRPSGTRTSYSSPRESRCMGCDLYAGVDRWLGGFEQSDEGIQRE